MISRCKGDVPRQFLHISHTGSSTSPGCPLLPSLHSRHSPLATRHSPLATRMDLRIALRTLRKTPAFTALSIITIALGVGANTAAFSMVRGVLLRRLPYAGDARLVRIKQPSTTAPDSRFSVLEIADYR